MEFRFHTQTPNRIEIRSSLKRDGYKVFPGSSPIAAVNSRAGCVVVEVMFEDKLLFQVAGLLVVLALSRVFYRQKYLLFARSVR
jgi:hypothetical protein